MPRKCPDVSVPKWDVPTPHEEWKLKLKVITPMFGGGYKAREVDPVCIIRPAAIRGHLRFWWRATQGAKFSSAEKLFEAEEALWGSAEKPSSVVIRTKLVEPGKEEKQSSLAPSQVKDYGPREGYFLFPFQEQRRERIPAAKARVDVGFQFHISFSKRWNSKTERHEELTSEELESVRWAVKAWLMFGGVGARTRRGCGALQVIGNNAKDWSPPSRDAADGWLKTLIPSKKGGISHTHLKGASVIIGKTCKNQDGLSAARVAWRTLGTFWARFRKGHVPGVRKDYEPMSKSDWNDYRGALVPFFNSKNRPASLNLAKPFLGLPIEYQELPPKAPYGPSIKPAKSGRMASPVILKPIAFANNSICPMIAVLSSPQPDRIRVDNKADKNEVDLTLPSSDPVLMGLKVSDPLKAVTKAAKEIWGASNIIEVTL